MTASRTVAAIAKVRKSEFATFALWFFDFENGKRTGNFKNGMVVNEDREVLRLLQ